MDRCVPTQITVSSPTLSVFLLSPSCASSSPPHTTITTAHSYSSSSPVLFQLAEGTEAGHQTLLPVLLHSIALMQLTSLAMIEKETWRNSWLIHSNRSMVCVWGCKWEFSMVNDISLQRDSLVCFTNLGAFPSEKFATLIRKAQMFVRCRSKCWWRHYSLAIKFT